MPESRVLSSRPTVNRAFSDTSGEPPGIAVRHGDTHRTGTRRPLGAKIDRGHDAVERPSITTGRVLLECAGQTERREGGRVA